MIKIWDLPSTEEEAMNYFQKHGILPLQKQCLNGHDMKLYFENDKQWRCNIRDCDQRISIRSGTWLEGSRIPLLTVLRFVYSWSQKLLTISWGKKQLDLDEKTVIEWDNYMREVCIESLLSRTFKRIGGPEKIVEIDEILLPKRKSHIGRILPQQWLFGGLCRETDEYFIVKVLDRKTVSLMDSIKEHIEDGSIIYSNSWDSCKTAELKLHFEDYIIDHKYNFVDPVSGSHIQSINHLCGSTKWRNKKHCGTPRKYFNSNSTVYLDSYLPEFIWRRMHEDKDLFITILTAIKDFKPPKTIIGRILCFQNNI